jgi:hypothetical protein
MSMRSTDTNERGAIIIQVAFALLALIAFNAFVVDLGVMWVSRREAQNAADAGALAGAIGLMQDGSSANTARSAFQFANTNTIWGQGNSSTNVDVTLSGSSGGCGTGCTVAPIPPCGAAEGCVRVDVFRNLPDRAGVTRGAAIPTFFGHLVGVSQQGVRATATAWTASGNSVQCMLPWGVIDRWSDNFDENKDPTYWPEDPLPGTAGWTSNDRYQPTPALGCGGAPCDEYIPPYQGNENHTGWKVDQDYGRQLVLKGGTTGNYSSGWTSIVNLPNTGGGADYRADIAGCNPLIVGIASAPADACPKANTPGMEANGCINVETGMKQGPTDQGVTQLVATDAGAYWNPGATGPKNRSGSVVKANGATNMESPRIRPLAVLDMDHYINSGCSGSGCVAKIANIIGFFVEGMCKDVKAANRLDPGMDCPDPTKDVVGRIVTLPGAYVSGVGTTATSASFIYVIQLVR